MKRTGIVSWALISMTPIVAFAKGPPNSGAHDRDVYALDLLALTGADGATDVYLDVDVRNPRHDAPTSSKHVRLASYDADGRLAWVDNARGLAFERAGDTSRIELRYSDMEAGQPVKAQVQVQTNSSRRTHVLRASGSVLLRPDVAVDSVDVEPQVPIGAPVNVVAELAELNGDVGATTDVVLAEGAEILDRADDVEIGAGGSASVVFSVVLDEPGVHDLEVRAQKVEPGDYDDGNNAYSVSVEAVDSLQSVPYSLAYNFLARDFEDFWETEQDTGFQSGSSRNERLDQILQVDAFLYPVDRFEAEIYADGELVDAIELTDVPISVFGDPCNEQARAFLSLAEGQHLYIDTRDFCDSAVGRVTYRRSAGESTVHSEGHNAIWGPYSHTIENRTGAAFLEATEDVATRIVVTSGARSWGGDASAEVQTTTSYSEYDFCDSWGCFWGWENRTAASGLAFGTTEP